MHQAVTQFMRPGAINTVQQMSGNGKFLEKSNPTDNYEHIREHHVMNRGSIHAGDRASALLPQQFPQLNPSSYKTISSALESQTSNNMALGGTGSRPGSRAGSPAPTPGPARSPSRLSNSNANQYVYQASNQEAVMSAYEAEQ